MEEGKIIHIIHTIVFFILGSFFSYISIQMISEAITRSATPLYLGLLGAVYLLFFLIAFILYIESFRSVNLNNNYFKISFVLNLFGLLTLISTILSSLFFLKGFGWGILGLFFLTGIISFTIFIISMIIFLIGYNKNKLNKISKEIQRRIMKDKTVWKIVKILLLAFVVFILLSPFIFFQIPKIKVSSKYINGSEITWKGGCIGRTICEKMGYSDQNAIEVGDPPYGSYHWSDPNLIVQEDTFRWLGIGSKIKCYHPATAGNELCVGFMNNLAKEECVVGESCDIAKYMCSNNPCNPGQCCIESKSNSCKNLDELGSQKDYPNIKISFEKPGEWECID